MKRIIFVICLVLTFSIAYVHAIELSGQVYESTDTKRGVSGLVLKLKPPKASQKPEKITKTDDKGNFIIKDLDKGKYLIEVYEATTMIYREVLEIENDTTKNIELEVKK